MDKLKPSHGVQKERTKPATLLGGQKKRGRRTSEPTNAPSFVGFTVTTTPSAELNFHPVLHKDPMARSLFRGAVITTGLPPSPQASTQPRPINSHHQAPSAASPLPSSSPLLTIPDAFDWDVLFKEQKANWARQEAAAAVAVAPPPSPGSPDTPPAPVFVQVEAPVTPPLGRESPLNPFSCSSLPTLPWRISAEVLQDVVRGAAAKAVARYGPLPSFSRRMESHSGLLMEEDEEGSGLIAEIQRSLDFE